MARRQVPHVGRVEYLHFRGVTWNAVSLRSDATPMLRLSRGSRRRTSVSTPQVNNPTTKGIHTLLILEGDTTRPRDATPGNACVRTAIYFFKFVRWMYADEVCRL